MLMVITFKWVIYKSILEKYQYDYFKISEQYELWQLGKLLLAAVCQRHRSEESNWVERQMHILQSRHYKCTERLLLWVPGAGVVKDKYRELSSLGDFMWCPYNDSSRGLHKSKAVCKLQFFQASA